MFQDIINILDGSTAKILLVVFVGFALYVLKEFRSHIKETLKSHSETIKKSTTKFEKDFKEVKFALAQHSADMDKHQKEIAGGALRLKEELMQAQVELNNEINKTKIGMVKINQTLISVGESVERYQTQLESTHGKVYDLEKSFKENKSEIGRVLRDLETVKEDYGKIKLIAQSGEITAKEAREIAETHRQTIEKVEAIFARAQEKKGQNGI